jgi:hypothetical protein
MPLGGQRIPLLTVVLACYGGNPESIQDLNVSSHSFGHAPSGGMIPLDKALKTRRALA